MSQHRRYTYASSLVRMDRGYADQQYPSLGKFRKRLEGGALIALGALAFYPTSGDRRMVARAARHSVGGTERRRGARSLRVTQASSSQRLSAELPGMLAGVVVFFGPALVLSGFLVMLTVSFVIHGAGKIVTAVRGGNRRASCCWPMASSTWASHCFSGSCEMFSALPRPLESPSDSTLPRRAGACSCHPMSRRRKLRPGSCMTPTLIAGFDWHPIRSSTGCAPMRSSAQGTYAETISNWF